MTSRAFPLHEEVVAAMYTEQVDPMERTFHAPASQDGMRVTALQREEAAGAVPSYRSTNLDFWRGFSTNQKYLQAKSAADVRKQARKKKPRRQINPLLVNRGKPSLAVQVQDQKLPPRNLTCKFPPPAAALSSGEGLVYEVQDLLRFAAKKHSRHYRPQPLEERDPQAAALALNEWGQEVGVVYRYIPEEDPDYVPPTLTHTHTEEGSRAGTAGALEKEEPPGLSSPSGPLDSPSHLDLSLDQNQNPSLLDSSCASPSLEKQSQSFVSGPTVVPSLNLSAVLASQISAGSKKKEEAAGATDGVDIVDDDAQTADSTFACDDNMNDNLDQQPSFAFTEGNEDFLFAKSMMDVTLATNTVMDDETKEGTAPHPRSRSRSRGKKSAKGRGATQQKQQQQQRQRLKPVKGVYGDIGASAPGGKMGQGPSRPKPGE
jgi:hypothetical protein